VRPEHLQLVNSEASDPGLNIISGKLSGRTFAGNLTRLFIDVGEETPVVVEARPQDAPDEIGVDLNIGWRPEDSRVLIE